MINISEKILSKWYRKNKKTAWNLGIEPYKQKNQIEKIKKKKRKYPLKGGSPDLKNGIS